MDPRHLNSDAMFEQLLAKHNGVRTWEFSQKNPVVCAIANSGGANFGTGICLALSANWVRDHALDSSVVTRIGGYMQGRTFIPLNLSALRSMRLQQLTWQHAPNPALKWLHDNGILMLKRSFNRPARLNFGRRLVRSMPSSKLATGRGSIENASAFHTELIKVSGAYVFILLSDPNGRANGHAMAAWVGARNEDACFFEPNFGECWFKHRVDFFKFALDFFRWYYSDISDFVMCPLSRRVK